MFRPRRRWAAVTAVAVTLALATPALASAQTSGATHQAVQPMRAARAFPSPKSTVIASIGFIDATQIGYFWSASRGDSVEQTIKGPSTAKTALLRLDVIDNGLSGADTDWTMSINGTDVGSFVIAQGVTGPIKARMRFKTISGPKYDVKIYMTNEVPSGDGAITLRYAGQGWHSITLK